MEKVISFSKKMLFFKSKLKKKSVSIIMSFCVLLLHTELFYLSPSDYWRKQRPLLGRTRINQPFRPKKTKSSPNRSQEKQEVIQTFSVTSSSGGSVLRVCSCCVHRSDLVRVLSCPVKVCCSLFVSSFIRLREDLICPQGVLLLLHVELC